MTLMYISTSHTGVDVAIFSLLILNASDYFVIYCVSRINYLSSNELLYSGSYVVSNITFLM